MFFLTAQCDLCSRLKRSGGAVQSKATKLVVWHGFRLGYGHTPRSKLFPSNQIVLTLQAELLCAAAAGVQAPQVNGQTARHGNDGLLAQGADGA